MLRLILFLSIPGVFLLLYNLYPSTFAAEDAFYRVIYLGLLLLFLSGSFFFVSKTQLKQNLKHLFTWGCLCLLFVTGYSFKDEFVNVSQRIKGELMPSSATEIGEGTVRIKKTNDGHFHILALVNGVPVMFLIDTGATGVVLALHDAQRLGFDLNQLDFNMRMSTANGTVQGASVRLDTISIESISINNLRGTVNGAPMDESLLGMEFLQNLDSYEVRGDSLYLTKYP